tara:strand:+ start:2443 stop:2652 length:210 start_codon:yes stop_codon:yes gene_type:complete
MSNWVIASLDDFIIWGDGSIDAVFTNELTGDVEWRPATPSQIAMYKQHKAWVDAGCPAETFTLSEILGA